MWETLADCVPVINISAFVCPSDEVVWGCEWHIGAVGVSHRGVGIMNGARSECTGVDYIEAVNAHSNGQML